MWDVQAGQQVRSFQIGRYPYAELNAVVTVLLIDDEITGIHTRDALTGTIIAVLGGAVACTTTVPASDVLSLISAIFAANTNPDLDTLCLATGSTYTLTTVNNTTSGANGLPPITSPLTIVGNGATITRDPAAPAFRLLFVDDTGDLTLQDVTLTRGLASGVEPGDDGGGVYNDRTLTVLDSTIANNTANSDGAASTTMARSPSAGQAASRATWQTTMVGAFTPRAAR